MPSNPYDKAHVYGMNQKVQSAQGENSRDIDARALLVCASKLNAAKELMEADAKLKNNLRVYGEAIRSNQHLWTIFQVALTDPDNQLPVELKVTLLNLSRYIDKTSFSALSKYAPNLIDSLISINRIIAAGLSRRPEGGKSAVSSANAQNNPASVLTSA